MSDLHLFFAHDDLMLPYAMLISVVMVVVTVLVHYEVLRVLTDSIIPRLRISPRRRLLVVMFGVFFAHTVEVWLFAICFYLMDSVDRFGGFRGEPIQSVFDYLYFASISYTSVGYGDIYPVGPLRLVTGLSALCGLLMIGWSASFTYLVMEKFWQLHGRRSRYDD